MTNSVRLVKENLHVVRTFSNLKNVQYSDEANTTDNKEGIFLGTTQSLHIVDNLLNN